MAKPSFFSDGSTPKRTDSKWRIRAKILGKYQDLSGSDPANDPRRTDTRYQQSQKILKHLA